MSHQALLLLKDVRLPPQPVYTASDKESDVTPVPRGDSRTLWKATLEGHFRHQENLLYLYLSKNLCYPFMIYVVSVIFCGSGLPFHTNVVIISLIQ